MFAVPIGLSNERAPSVPTVFHAVTGAVADVGDVSSVV